jgi:hypothetical protein
MIRRRADAAFWAPLIAAAMVCMSIGMAHAATLANTTYDVGFSDLARKIAGPAQDFLPTLQLTGMDGRMLPGLAAWLYLWAGAYLVLRARRLPSALLATLALGSLGAALLVVIPTVARLAAGAAG